jgi:hypothetical protein
VSSVAVVMGMRRCRLVVGWRRPGKGGDLLVWRRRRGWVTLIAATRVGTRRRRLGPADLTDPAHKGERLVIRKTEILIH